MYHLTRSHLQLLHLLAVSEADENIAVSRKALNDRTGEGTDDQLRERGFARVKGDFIHITLAGIREASRLAGLEPDGFYEFIQEYGRERNMVARSR